MIKVLLPLHGLVTWNGGVDLMRLLVNAINRQTFTEQIELSFALPEASAGKRVAVSVLRTWRELLAGRLASSSGRATGLLKAAEEITTGRMVIPCSDDAAGILHAARVSRADIVFPTMHPLGTSSIKRIGYIFDFQHHYLPDLFPARIRKNRDTQFRRVVDDSTGIVVNSRQVAQDVERFLNVLPRRILAMPFAPYAHPWWFELDSTSFQERYGIGQSYLLVCNHLWKHKDHATALRAFAMLHRSVGLDDLQLVLTGDTIDHRDPGHFRRLRVLCDELGIARCTHFLGLIPKRDQLALLRGSAALMQPTLFEGGPGGGAVYEAIGMGIPAIVSDLPVNREVDQGDVRFFRAGDAVDLAEKTIALLTSPRALPDSATLLANGEQNLARLGNAIVSYLARVAHGAS